MISHYLTQVVPACGPVASQPGKMAGRNTNQVHHTQDSLPICFALHSQATSMDISSEMIQHQLSQRTAFNTENPGLTLKLIKPVIPSCLYKQPNVTAKQYPCNYHELPPISINGHAGLSFNKVNACKGRCFLYAYKYILELDICDLPFWLLYKTSQCSEHCVF